jgi:hypothetical protein
MADLANLTSDYNPEAGMPLELRGPDDAQLFNDDGTPMTLTLLGADSDVAVRARNANQNRRLQQGPRMKLTAEGLEADGASYLAKLTVGWNITLGGQKPPFSYEAAVKLYANPKLAFVREQADAFIADRANFLKASPTS